MDLVTVGQALGLGGRKSVTVRVGRVACVSRVVGCFLSSSRLPQLTCAEDGATGGNPHEKVGNPRPYVGSCASASRFPHEIDADGGTKVTWSLGVGAGGGAISVVSPSSCRLPHDIDADGWIKVI